MRATLVLLSALSIGPLFAQAPAPSELPKDPAALLALAAPLYDFNSPDLKPWHMKVSYQLYDDQEKPTEQGKFEYWWASPELHRASWTRPSATHTDWHTVGGKHAYLGSGQRLNYFEYELQRVLLSPLPDQASLDPEKFRLERQTTDSGKIKLPCVMVIPKMPQHGLPQAVPLGLFPTYCFDPHLPALHFSFSFGSVTAELNQIVRFQNRYISRSIAIFEGRRKLLTASIDQIGGLQPSDAALIPAQDAQNIRSGKVTVGAGVAAGMLVKKQVPVYPQDAKDARVSGKVVLAATIGLDGGVHELHVVETPWPTLAVSALAAVSRWQYRPYLLNGEPVEIQTTINVIYSLSN